MMYVLRDKGQVYFGHYSTQKHFIPKIKKYHTRVTMYKQKPNRYKYINSAINANPVILHYCIDGVRKKK